MESLVSFGNAEEILCQVSVCLSLSVCMCVCVCAMFVSWYLSLNQKLTHLARLTGMNPVSISPELGLQVHNATSVFPGAC